MLSSGTMLAHRFRVTGPLGRGGTSEAYRARDLVADEDVALKVLRDERLEAAFRTEFERLRELAHPALVSVRELWHVTHGGRPLTFYSAELVRGEGLSAHAARVTFHEARAVLGDVLEGLAVLHGLGLRHGDVKPDNVRVSEAGRGVLLDLGCAAPLGLAQADVSGTPGYLAPELLAGAPADERSDVYAFGVMLGELFRDAPKKLLARATHAEPAKRPASAAEMLTLLGDDRPLERVRLSRPPRLLGRAEERARMADVCAAWRRADVAPRVLWMHGPDGVGVSRMLRELSLSAAPHFERIDLRTADDTPVRTALARAFGEAPPSAEALLETLDELARSDTLRMFVLDDAHALSFQARQELALCMRALPEDGRLSFVVGSHDAPPASAPVTALALSPLALDDVVTWTGDFGTEGLAARLLAFTGGMPRELERSLDALSSGRASEADLSAVGAEAGRRQVLAARVSALSEEQRETLSRVLVLGHVPRSTSDASLLATGLLSAEGDRLVLARTSDRPHLAATLDPRVLRRLHGARAKELAQAREPVQLADAIAHLFGAGEWARAVSLFERVEPLVDRAPRAFLAALRGHEARLSPAALVVLARAARLAAESRVALSLLARARRALDRANVRAFACEAAETRLALGQPARALRLVTALDDATSRGLELSARLHARLGEHASALQLGHRALELAEGPSERARAAETLALAEAYLGQSELALAHVDEAAALLREQDPRAHARCMAFRGFVLLRAGRVAEAAEAYVRTLEVATAHELLDLAVNALTNLGSTRHMQGSYGAALSFYERALRLGRGLGRNVRVLRANLANLSLEIGAFARAEAELAQLEGAELASLPLYRAELALWTGAPERALALLASLALGGREGTEVGLLEAQAQLSLGRLERVDHIVSELTATGDSTIDLAARLACLRAELALVRGEARTCLPWLEDALGRLRGSGLDPLIARVEGLLARTASELSAHALAAEHRARQRARLERMALDLAPSLRDAFWRHPLRQSAHVERATDAPKAGRSTLSLSRLFDINRRITSTLSVNEVLDRAMDAAIELTLAERGFVLTREGAGELKVAAARHFGGEELKRREQKLSRSIAERVLESGEPVWTVDAGTDQRFAQKASVHAMRLKSVLCVPIRHAGKVVGALYLDNRLERARFAAADAELLLAFADQVAIALHNARLVAELESQRHELVRERRKVEELLRGKTAEVERLERALSASRAAFETRYDYSQIVGRSEPMRKVLSVLDRVIDSDVNVLVMGESGTGKELVARAIHAHGPRKNAPFVDLNCAALPEALLEAELFGHVKGAFTSADRDREGLLRTAQGGTVFLDELGEMSLAMQAKLLRVLSDREVRPVGGTRSYPLDVRFVCATNRDLEARVREGAFREDLYYRVAVVSVTLPPLRERSDDILLLSDTLLAKRAKDTGEPPRSLAPDARRALLAHPWPGNVRELENTLVRASVMASGALIREADLGLGASEARVRRTPQNRKDFETLEAERLVAALEAERWNVSRVARALGIPRNTLYRKLERYGIRT